MLSNGAGHMFPLYQPREQKSYDDQETMRMELDGWTLWRQFNDVGTEMIVTKSGR